MKGSTIKKAAAVIAVCAALAFACAADAPAAGAQADWASFWAKFKTAVVNGDKQTVLSLSDSPQMPADYAALFGTRAKKRCFARARPVKDEQGGYSVFCGEQGYYFKKVGGRFRFTETFAND